MAQERLAKTSRIVVVDPNLDDYRCLIEPARSQKVRFTLTSTGSGALRLVPSFADAVWLVSLQLPDMEGFELLAMIRSLQEQLRTVVVDETYDAERERRALESSAIQYVCKPVLLDWITAWTQISSDWKQSQAIAPQGMAKPKTDFSVPTPDQSHLIRKEISS